MLTALPVNTLIATDVVPIFCRNLEKNISASTDLKKMKMIFFSQLNTITIDHSFADRPLPTAQEIYQEFCQDPRAQYAAVIPAFEDPKMQEAIKFLQQKNLMSKERFLEAKKDPLKSQLEPAIIETLKRGLEEVPPNCLKNLSIEITFAQKNAPEKDLSICFYGNPRAEEGSIVNLFRLKTPFRLGQFFLEPLKKVARAAFALFKSIVCTMAHPFKSLTKSPVALR